MKEVPLGCTLGSLSNKIKKNYLIKSVRIKLPLKYRADYFVNFKATWMIIKTTNNTVTSLKFYFSTMY